MNLKGLDARVRRNARDPPVFSTIVRHQPDARVSDSYCAVFGRDAYGRGAAVLDRPDAPASESPEIRSLARRACHASEPAEHRRLPALLDGGIALLHSKVFMVTREGAWTYCPKITGRGRPELTLPLPPLRIEAAPW